VGLSLTLIGLYALLQFAALAAGVPRGALKPGMGTVLVGLSLIVLGCTFLASYYYSHKAFLFRALLWVCEHASYPKGRGMAFFYFFLASGLGTMAVLAGLGAL
jgi:hypothetical protein